MKKAVTTLMVVSLTGNVFPLINILAIFSLFPFYFLGRDAVQIEQIKYGPETAKKFLLAAYIYWFLSYALTGASLSNFFSFEFLRFDGALFIAYLPLFLFSDVCLDPRFVRRSVALFLTATSLVALLGLAEFVDTTIVPFGLASLPEPLQLLHSASTAADIFHGFFRAHNAAGATYAMASLISFSLLVRGADSSLAAWPALWLAANFVGLALTQSRTAYVAFLGALVLVLVRRGPALKKLLKFGGFILLPLVYFLLVQPVVNQRTEEVSNLEDPNIVLRFAYYQRAVADFLESPIVGTGFGRFNDEFKVFTGIPHVVFVATGGDSVNDDSHAHNSYLHFLAEGGVLGLALMLAVWIATFRWLGRKREMFEEGSFGNSLALAIQSCIVLEFLMSFTEHMMGTATSALTIFTLVGLFFNLLGWRYRVASVVFLEPSPPKELQTWPAR
ncbi:MAG: O-antigen ligase family protein [Candidatus Acidiferrum sp.]|jgi:O-antigen ligase